MKRFAALFLCLMLLCGTAVADASWGNWEKKAYIDEFGMDTDDFFLLNTEGEGTYSSTVAFNEKLYAFVYCHYDFGSDFITIRLVENGRTVVQNATEEDIAYEVAMLDAAGTRHSMTGYMAAGDSDIVIYEKGSLALLFSDFEGGDAGAIIEAMKAGGTIRFSITQSNKPMNSYIFAIDVTGFANIYEGWAAENGWYAKDGFDFGGGSEETENPVEETTEAPAA